MQAIRIGALAALTVLGTALEPPRAQDDPARVPAELVDIDGRRIDVAALARDRNLVLVTLKAPWCPVCHEQLLRLRARGAELEACGVTFLVLAPGPADQLDAVRQRTGFPHPFIADKGLAVARSLGLAMTEELIQPCMLQVLPDLRVGWRQLGRSGAYFGDAELAEFFDCARAV